MLKFGFMDVYATIVLVALCGASSAFSQVIHEDLRLRASDTSMYDAAFGRSVATDGVVIAIGAPADDDNGMFSGSVYLFDFVTGQELAKLVPEDVGEDAAFGLSLAIADGILVVGSPFQSVDGVYSGSVYLYDLTSYKLLRKLTPEDGAESDYFGWSVDIEDGLVVVGAQRDDDNGTDSGAVYVFDAITGQQVDKLLPTDGEAQDDFGVSVAVDDGKVVVGAQDDVQSGVASGSVYLFDLSTGSQLLKIAAQDAEQGDEFGCSVAINGDFIVVGSRRDDDFGSRSGSVYIFDRFTGAESYKLNPDEPLPDAWFGYSLALDGDVLCVGARFADEVADQSGGAYVFRMNSGAQLTKLLPLEGMEWDHFGTSVAVRGGTLLVGAPCVGGTGASSGAVYLFSTSLDCLPDFNFDNTLNFFDVSAFLSSFIAEDTLADMNGDRAFDFFDVGAFIAAYNAGCP